MNSKLTHRFIKTVFVFTVLHRLICNDEYQIIGIEIDYGISFKLNDTLSLNWQCHGIHFEALILRESDGPNWSIRIWDYDPINKIYQIESTTYRCWEMLELDSEEPMILWYSIIITLLEWLWCPQIQHHCQMSAIASRIISVCIHTNELKSKYLTLCTILYA